MKTGLMDEKLLRHICTFTVRDRKVGQRYFSSTSYYVTKARTTEWMKNDDSSLLAEFKRSSFLLFVDKMPFLRRSSSSLSDYTVPLLTYEELSRVTSSVGLVIDHKDAALVDVTPMQNSTNDLDEEFLPVFALGLRSSASVSLASDVKKFEAALKGEFVDVRRAFFLLNEPSSMQLLAKGQSLLRWARCTKYCSKCATPLQMKVSKSVATCSKCSMEFHPTISPVAITLVTNDKNDHALLVRQPRHPPALFTAVAGFVEIGEPLEETVRREVAEEVGVDIHSVRYAGVSQPWPFPQMSLMCGFFATVHGLPEPLVCTSELEDAQWFTRSEVEAAFMNTINVRDMSTTNQPEKKFSYVPPAGAVAHDLIKRWLSER